MEREKSMDYVSMIYAAPIRDAAAAPQDVVKPHKQETKEEKGGASGRSKVSRALQSSLNVLTSEDNTQINVSSQEKIDINSRDCSLSLSGSLSGLHIWLQRI